MSHLGAPSWIFLTLAIPVHSAGAQSAGFVVRLGRDTIAVERFSRTSTSMEGELLRRTPATHVIRYEVTLGANGLPTDLTFSITRHGATASPGSIRGGRILFQADSARIELQRDTLQVRRVAARTGVPALPESYPLYEIWLSRLMASGQDSLSVSFVAPLGGPAGAVRIHRLGADSALLPVFGAAVRMRTDRNGRLLGLDGRATTIKYEVERVEAVDVRGLAQGFTAGGCRVDAGRAGEADY